MELYEIKNGLEDARLLLDQLNVSANIEVLKREIEGLTVQTMDEHFWDDQAHATKVYAHLNEMKKVADTDASLEASYKELMEVYEYVKDTEDPDFMASLEEDYMTFHKNLDEFEKTLLFDQEYDHSNAIVEIHPGAGGTESQDWAEMLSGRTKTKNVVNTSAEIIGRRAALELKPDDIVNIGVGIPETVSKYARENGILDKITLTVESGGVGGFPASGKVFGAVIGADSIYDMANQFDLYNNGGLDICFMGGIEVDRFGNVNAHKGPGAFAGVGGFANITAKTATVVFCLTFDTKGLAVEDNDGIVTIKNEGSIPKFVNDVRSISFSGKRALANRQRVIYVTERCVFELTEKGLKLIEVYPGIDLEHDILNKLPFKVEVDERLR